MYVTLRVDKREGRHTADGEQQYHFCDFAREERVFPFWGWHVLDTRRVIFGSVCLAF